MSKFNVLEIKTKKRKRSSQCLMTNRSPKESGGIQQEWKRRKGEAGGAGETKRREGLGRRKAKESGGEWEGIRSTQVMGSIVFPKPLGCGV